MSKFKVIINKEACIGCGSCEAVCPGNFKMENGKAKAIKEVIEDTKCSQMAAESCPTDAIEIKKID
ncbi:MAG TPA: ferredoxin [Patescibacteria group bacterium]|nr:ferredoxin [Patescibacteria group bacterium]